MTDVELISNWSAVQKNQLLRSLLADHLRRNGVVPLKITESDASSIGYLVSCSGELSEVDLDDSTEDRRQLRKALESLNRAIPYEDLLRELEQEDFKRSNPRWQAQELC